MKPGSVTSFPHAVKLNQLNPDEIVVSSWIIFKSRKHRDSVSAKVMESPLFAGMDAKSMFWDGFKRLMEL